MCDLPKALMNDGFYITAVRSDDLLTCLCTQAKSVYFGTISFCLFSALLPAAFLQWSDCSIALVHDCLHVCMQGFVCRVTVCVITLSVCNEAGLLFMTVIKVLQFLIHQ